MKKLFVLLAVSLLMITGCKKNKPVNPSDESGTTTESEESINTEITITVNFYLDFNQVEAKNIYETMTVHNGEKLTEPTRPTEAPFPEFPIFKGWSKKEIIDDVKDLWNFSTDLVKVTEGNTLSLFGIWVADGE